MYDCFIIGGGPAGLSANIYAVRSGLKTAIIEKMFHGGQIVNTSEIENYLGFPEISGVEIANKFHKHSKEIGGEWLTGDVISITENNGIKTVKTSKGDFETKTVIIATGATPRMLGIKGEAEYRGRGVSYCGTCDGNFYKGKKVAVIGGGNTALEDSLFLARICEEVYLIHRRDEFRGDKILANKVLETPNIKFIKDTVPTEIISSENKLVDKIIVKNVKDEKISEIDISGVFVAVGTIPQSDFTGDFVTKNAAGYITTKVTMETNVDGVYAAGDVRDTVLKQVVTAVSDGAVAAYSASLYVASL